MAPVASASPAGGPAQAGPSNPRPAPHRREDGEDDGVIKGPGRLPAAAKGPAPGASRRGASSVFALTLLSAVDGSLLALAAAGQLETLGGALTV
ncbi:MAG: hypothetical protein ACYC2H_13720, partial [Thermoplasmatota archaeon]